MIFILYIFHTYTVKYVTITVSSLVYTYTTIQLEITIFILEYHINTLYKATYKTLL